MVVRYLEQHTRGKHFSFRERQCEKPVSGAAVAKGKSKGKGSRNGGDCVQWTTTDQCSRRDNGGMKHHLEKNLEPNGKGQAFATVQLCTTEFLGKRGPRKEKDCPKENVCDHWPSLEPSFHHEGTCKPGSNCALEQMEKAGSEPKKRNKSVVVASSLDLTHAEEKIHFAEMHGEGRPCAWDVSCSSETNIRQKMSRTVSRSSDCPASQNDL